VFAERSSNPARGFLLLPDEVMHMLIDPQFDDETRT